MAKPVLAYLSMLNLATTTVTDPGTETGYDIDDIYDFKAYSLWKSNTTVKPINIDIDTGAGGATADYIGIVNSNLTTLGATVQVLSGAASPGATERLAATAVATDDVWYQGFTVATAQRYWRVAITVAGASFASAPYIGELFLGMKTELPEYIAPSMDPYFKQIEIAGSRSQGGHYLGGVMRGQVHRATITFGEAGAARASFTSDLNPFIDNHAMQRKPFIFILDTADSDFDTARYVRVRDDAEIQRLAVGGAFTRFTFALPVEEAFVEAP